MTTPNPFLLKTACQDAWKRIGTGHHHGINLPLFCLYSHKSCGIGEFPDLLPVIDWLKSVGMDVLQLLPLNDSGHDLSPYNARSSRALNPIFLGLARLPDIPKDLLGELQALQMLTATRLIPYEGVRQGKRNWLRKYLTVHASNLRQDPAYRSFLAQERGWIEGYALFCLFKDRFDQQSHVNWPSEFSLPKPQYFAQWVEKEAQEIELVAMEQFLLFSQWNEVHLYATKAGVHLMGDIPILISPDSADVWQWPGLFHELLSAGAPPDMYAPEGQNWGFPLYHWKAIEQQDFHWWKERLHVANQLYDIFRIDHVVGFFRIWAVLEGKSAKEGVFIPYKETSWQAHGTKLLEMLIGNSQMLPIAEDLGVVPPFVRQVLQQLGIPGTRVMRWERYWHQKDAPFIPLDQYMPESLTTVSTHDSSSLRLWWKEQPDEAKFLCQTKKWKMHSSCPQEYLKAILHDSHQTKSLFHVNLWHEYFSLFEELSPSNPQEDRINVPGTCNPQNWSMRFKQPIDFIVDFDPLRQCIGELLH